MAQYDGSIRIGTKIDTKGIYKGEAEIKNSVNRLTNSIKKMGSLIGAAFAVNKLVQFGKEALQAASDFEAMEAQFSQVFGELESTASESLSRVAGQAGIMEERMKNSFTKIAAFAKTTGMDTASSLKLSERAMIAVADSAAFYDRSLEETTEYLQSFLKGNYENDAALGLSATEFTRNAAANKLYGKSFIELSEAQKQLTLLTMVEDANRLSGALGQAAREADTWTNQTGNLSRAWANLKATLGQAILPIAIQIIKKIAAAVNAVNNLISKVITAAGAFRSLSELITGNKSSGSIGSTGISGENYNNAAEGAENLASSMEDTAKATKKAEKAAQKYLSPLDKINNISLDKGDSGSEGAGGSSGGDLSPVENMDFGNLAEGETVIDKLSDSFMTVVDYAKKLKDIFAQGFFDGLGDWEYRWETIKSSISSIKDSLVDIWTDPAVLSAADLWLQSVMYLFGSLTGSALSIGLTAATNLLGGISQYLEDNSDRIKNHLISMFNIKEDINYMFADLFQSIAYVFEAFASESGITLTANLIGIFANAFMGVTEISSKLIRDILNIFIQPFVDNKEGFRTALEGFLGVLAEVAGTIKQGIDDTFQKLNEVYDTHFKPFFDSVAQGLSDLTGQFLDFWNGNVQPILDEWASDFDNLWKNNIQPFLDEFIDVLGKVADYLKEVVWEGVLKPFISWIINNVLPIILPIIDDLWTTIKDFVAYIVNIAKDILKVLGGIIDFLIGVFTGDWDKAFNGIKDIVQGALGFIKDTIDGSLTFVKNIVKTGLDFVKGQWEVIFDGIKTIVNSAIGKVKTDIKTSIDFFKEIFSNFKETIGNIWTKTWQGLKDTVSNVFGGIESAIKNIVNGILGTVEKMANGIIKGINFVISALNNLKIEIPSAIADLVGFDSFGFNIPELKKVSIPRLATGAVIPANREFLAILGDQKHGTNIEAPLDTIKQAVREELSSITGQCSSGSIELHLTVECEGYKLLQLIQKLDQEQFARTQRPSFQI